MTQTHFVPPMKEGISASKLYLPKCSPMPATVFDYVCQKFDQVSREEWRLRFEANLVLSLAGEALLVDTPYQHGQTIYYYKSLPYEAVVPFEHHIIFENEHLLVVDKPHFLTVAPAGQYVKQTLLTRLKADFGNADISPIHRLDRETAGLILFAKTPQARALYQRLFATQDICKTYHAIAPYRADLPLPMSLQLYLERGEPFYTMKVGQGVPNTHTQIDLLEISADGRLAKYQLQPSTGKLHQLRVHLNHLGIAIINDSYYPVVEHRASDDFDKPLQLLAKHLCFDDPITGETMAFSSRFELGF